MVVYLHNTGYYLTFKKNKLTKFTGKLMELEAIILGEVTRHRKTNVACLLLFVDISLESSDLCVLFVISTEVRKCITLIGW